MSDTLVKAIRVGVQNSPKVSLCANPGHFLKVSTSHYQTSALLEAGHSPLISLIGGDLGRARYRGSADDNDGALRDAGRHNWLVPKDNKQQRYQASQRRSVHFSFLSALLNDTGFSKHQKISGHFPSRARSLVVLGPGSFFSTCRRLTCLR